MTWTALTQHRAQLGEGPFWDAPTQALYWVDIAGKQALLRLIKPADILRIFGKSAVSRRGFIPGKVKVHIGRKQRNRAISAALLVRALR